MILSRVHRRLQVELPIAFPPVACKKTAFDSSSAQTHVSLYEDAHLGTIH